MEDPLLQPMGRAGPEGKARAQGKPGGVAQLGGLHQSAVFFEKTFELGEQLRHLRLQGGIAQEPEDQTAALGSIGAELQADEAAVGPEEQVQPGGQAEGEEFRALHRRGQQVGPGGAAVAVVAHRTLLAVQGGGVGDGHVVVVEGVVVGDLPVAIQVELPSAQQQPGLLQRSTGLREQKI